jgi:iron complex outermembrane recepter protein
LLNSTLALRSGFAPVDLLSRNALGLGGSSRPRHLYDFSVGYAERGLGLRLVGQRRGVSYLDLGERDEDALRFAPLTILTVRGFVDAQRLLPALHAIGGLRLSLTVSNLTNARQRVRNALGETPLRYQPGYLDSVGRSVQLELRKAF